MNETTLNSYTARIRDTENPATSKPQMPVPAPQIEVFPGIHATLLSDYSKYSNGSLLMMCTAMTAKGIGEIGADGAGRWYFQIGDETYVINMQEVFSHLVNLLTTPKP